MGRGGSGRHPPSLPLADEKVQEKEGKKGLFVCIRARRVGLGFLCYVRSVSWCSSWYMLAFMVSVLIGVFIHSRSTVPANPDPFIYGESLQSPLPVLHA